MTTFLESAVAAPPTILIITSSGGAGHLQAAVAEKMRVLEKYPGARIIEQDVLMDWGGKRFGTYCKNRWNDAQTSGDILELERLVYLQPVIEKLMFMPIFVALFRLLMKEPIDRIIDTQPIGTSPILKAIKAARTILKKPLILEKMVTELPTEAAAHFFRPIKNLSKEERKLLRLITTIPLTEEGQSEDLFWKDTCGIDRDSVHYERLPLRPSFNKYQKDQRSKESFDLLLPLQNGKEIELVLKTLKKGSATYQLKHQGLKVSIQPEDQVSVLMLGSHPDEKALLFYAKEFIKVSQEKRYMKRKDLLFIFCCNNKNLQEQIVDIVTSEKDYPSSLSIFPLSFQKDDVIAPLFFRSNATFTKSGGLTSMELLSVCEGKIWIHKADPIQKMRILRKPKENHFGMPPWENGNALYLKAKKGADFISPATFREISEPFFEE